MPFAFFWYLVLVTLLVKTHCCFLLPIIWLVIYQILEYQKRHFMEKIICPERHKAIPTITIFALASWPFLHYELWQQTDYSSQVVSKVPWIKKIANYKQSENYLTSKSLTLENSNEKKNNEGIKVPVRRNLGSKLQINYSLSPGFIDEPECSKHALSKDYQNNETLLCK